MFDMAGLLLWLDAYFGWMLTLVGCFLWVDLYFGWMVALLDGCFGWMVAWVAQNNCMPCSADI